MKITERERDSIKEAIKHAELNTSGEIVPVILDRSTCYSVANYKTAISLGIIAPIACYALAPFAKDYYLIAAEVAGLITGFAIGYIPMVKRVLTPKKRMDEAVHTKAIEYFYEHQVSKTRDRT